MYRKIGSLQISCRQQAKGIENFLRKADMPRVRKGSARRKPRKRILKSVRGGRGAPGHLYRLAKEAATRANVYARVGRKLRKRNFRGLWIIRLSAACRQRGIRYSQFINGLKKANITLNRKMLSEIAIADPAGFDAIVEAAKAAISGS
jgi:large subunit ribosomal protein L20